MLTPKRNLKVGKILKKINCDSIITAHGNSFVITPDELGAVYLNPKGSVLRYATPEEWYHALRTYWHEEPISIGFSKGFIEKIEASVERQDNFEEDIDETCRIMGTKYLIHQPTGDVIHRFISGDYWHGYEGAIGYQPRPVSTMERYTVDGIRIGSKKDKIVRGKNRPPRRN